jgi:hypothetical protein
LMATAGDSSQALDMRLLSERIERVRAYEAGEESEVALLLLDAMLPRQRLQAELERPLIELLRSLHGAPVVVCGLERGLRMPRPLRVGVATTVHLPDPLSREAELTVSFVGGKMCEILGLLDRDATFGLGVPVFTARVRWLGLRRQGSDPESFGSEAEASSLRGRAAALLKRAEEWIELVRQTGRERCVGQMDRVSSPYFPIAPLLASPLPHKHGSTCLRCESGVCPASQRYRRPSANSPHPLPPSRHVCRPARVRPRLTAPPPLGLLVFVPILRSSPT